MRPTSTAYLHIYRLKARDVNEHQTQEIFNISFAQWCSVIPHHYFIDHPGQHSTKRNPILHGGVPARRTGPPQGHWVPFKASWDPATSIRVPEGRNSCPPSSQQICGQGHHQGLTKHRRLQKEQPDNIAERCSGASTVVAIAPRLHRPLQHHRPCHLHHQTCYSPCNRPQ